jgi:hypothetical protein
MTNTESLVGTTTRPVTFAEADRKGISHPRRMPAGTSVYVSRIKDDGMCTIRVCGSLMTQQVHMFTTVVPC